MDKKQSGSCLCGQVKFEVDGVFESFFLCHCKYCQKDTGSAHAANLFSTSAQLLWLSGSELVQTYQLPSTKHTHSFCSRCGSALPHQQSGALLKVPAGSLDSQVSIHATARIFYSSRADWESALENIKSFETFPS